MFDRRQRLFIELSIVALAIVVLIFLAPYLVQLSHAPWLDGFGHPSRSTLMGESFALFALPPVFTIFIAITNITLYYTKSVPLVYGVILLPIVITGWLGVLALWSNCVIYVMWERSDRYCYSRYLDVDGGEIHGVTDALGVVAFGLVCVLIAIYLWYLYVVARDFHQQRRSKESTTTADKLELVENNSEQESRFRL